VSDRFEELFYFKERMLPVEAEIFRVTWVDGAPVWELDLRDGVRGLVPADETGLPDPALMQRYVGQKVRVLIKGINREAGLAACSRREAEQLAQRRFFERAKEGDAVPGVVRAVLPKGEGAPERVVVELAGGAVTVEVPRKDATLSQALRLVDIFAPGQEVQCRITHYDPSAGTARVSLLPETDPWQTFPEARRGDVLACRVVRQAAGIVFLEARPGVVGIAAVPIRGELRRGDVVAAAVTKFDRAARKLRLRLRGAPIRR